MLTPRTMDTMPASIEEETRVLLYCPDQGGWHTAMFYGGRWVDFACLKVELEPTHWLPLPPDPEGIGE